ncbi:taste receptor type 2 member 13 [Tupaia chinensis]|uniref:taste receptor type 2 member 13 n=1 Tax=Tupaia chinensis TaxID=246437 RepID=UPI0003C8DAE6|nr:taste receptor type 2 member 13 [Tupaia chinensis]
MESALQSIFSLLIVAGLILGNLSNGFIVLTNCIDWTRKRKLSLADQILTALAIFRIGMIWEIIVSWFGYLHYLNLFTPGEELRIAIFTWAIVNHFSLWLATMLSIFYLLKIASFANPIFLYLKQRVKKIILMILLGSLVFLFLNMIELNIHIRVWKHQYERNTTWNSERSDFALFSSLVLFTMTMFSLIPFSVALISFLLLIFSLWKHLQKMQLYSEEHRDFRTKAHVNALKTVISFLLLFASFFLSLLMSWISQMHRNELANMLSQTLGMMYPSAHSFILILGNSKLRQASLSVALKCGQR